VNKCLEGNPHFFAYDKQTQWVKWLPLEEWWYNTSFHRASKMFPFMEIYGYHPPSITSPFKGHSKVQVVKDHLQDQEEVLKILKDNFDTLKNKMKKKVDQHCNQRNFEEVD